LAHIHSLTAKVILHANHTKYSSILSTDPHHQPAIAGHNRGKRAKGEYHRRAEHEAAFPNSQTTVERGCGGCSSQNELMELMPVRDLLLRIPIILILPDHEQETITKGHSLRPRYLTYIDYDLSDVGDVFKKIVYKANEDRHLDAGGFHQEPHL